MMYRRNAFCTVCRWPAAADAAAESRLSIGLVVLIVTTDMLKWGVEQ